MNSMYILHLINFKKKKKLNIILHKNTYIGKIQNNLLRIQEYIETKIYYEYFLRHSK